MKTRVVIGIKTDVGEMRMLIRCAWCKPPRIMEEKEPFEGEGITDGICDDCLAKHFPNVYEKCKVFGVSEKGRCVKEARNG